MLFPIPLDAPVMTAVFSFNENSDMVHSDCSFSIATFSMTTVVTTFSSGSTGWRSLHQFASIDPEISIQVPKTAGEQAHGSCTAHLGGNSRRHSAILHTDFKCD